MTREEWRKEILKKLVDRHETMTAVCKNLNCSRAWIYKVILGEAGSEAQTEWEKKINSYLGIEGEPQDD